MKDDQYNTNPQRSENSQQQLSTNQNQNQPLVNSDLNSAKFDESSALSSVLAIISLVLGCVSMIPFLGFLSIFSIILSIGSFIRKESKTMSFIALMLGYTSLANSPLVIDPITTYLKCKIFDCEERIDLKQPSQKTATTASTYLIKANER